MCTLWILGIVILARSGESAHPEGNATDGRSVEYSDYLEVSSFKKYDRYFDYYNVAPDGANESEVIIFKCCPQGQFFDVDNYQCVEDTNSTDFDILDKIQNEWNESSYRVVENLPECGADCAVSVQTVSKMGFDPTRVIINRKVFSTYCIEKHPRNPQEVVILTCSSAETVCKTRPCFRKCCPVGQSLALSNHECQKTNDSFRPETYDLSTLVRIDTDLSRFGVLFGDVCGTERKFLLQKEKGEMSYLGQNGMLFVPSHGKNYALDDFCIEYVETENCSSVETFLCFSAYDKTFQNSPLQFLLVSLGLLLSCLFLLLTFLVYLFTPKSQNLYGKTLMCYIASLFAAYLCLALIQLMSQNLDRRLCTNLGYSVLFSFLAAFFWLNVMSFDIWKTFRLDRSVEKTKNRKGRIQFVFYSAYAWSFPAAIVVACVCVNQSQVPFFESIKPHIEDQCWFTKKTKGIYVFFVIPVLLIMTCNVIFYVQTALKISSVKANLKKMEKQKRKRFSSKKDQFIINGKLFVVMGITWSMEIISFFFPHPFWYVIDIANALHGVFIFTIFVLKKKVLQNVSQQLQTPLNRMRDLTSSNSEDSSSSRKVLKNSQTEGKTCATVTAPTFESKN